MAVTNAQHFFAVIIVTARFTPQVCRLQRRHQQWDVTRALLFHNYDDWSLRARRSLTEDAAGSDLALTVQPFTDVRTIIIVYPE